MMCSSSGAGIYKCRFLDTFQELASSGAGFYKCRSQKVDT